MATKMWSVKTGGLSWQWSLKTGFTVLIGHISMIREGSSVLIGLYGREDCIWKYLVTLAPDMHPRRKILHLGGIRLPQLLSAVIHITAEQDEPAVCVCVCV